MFGQNLNLMTLDTVVESFLTAFQKADYTSASEYIMGSTLKTEFDTAKQQIIDAIATSMTYEDIEVKSQSDNTAEVTAKITSLNGNEIINDIMPDVISLAFAYAFSDNGEEQLQNKVNELTINAFTAEDAPKSTTEYTFQLSKTEDGWKIVSDTELMDCLTGGMYSYYDMATEETVNDDKEGPSNQGAEIHYISCSVDDIFEETEQDIATAENKYLNKDVELTGFIGEINAEKGTVILETSPGNFYYGVTCSTSEKAKLKTLEQGNWLTVKGKIVSVKEPVGCALKIESIGEQIAYAAPKTNAEEAMENDWSYEENYDNTAEKTTWRVACYMDNNPHNKWVDSDFTSILVNTTFTSTMPVYTHYRVFDDSLTQEDGIQIGFNWYLPNGEIVNYEENETRFDLDSGIVELDFGETMDGTLTVEIYDLNTGYIYEIRSVELTSY